MVPNPSTSCLNLKLKEMFYYLRHKFYILRDVTANIKGTGRTESMKQGRNKHGKARYHGDREVKNKVNWNDEKEIQCPGLILCPTLLVICPSVGTWTQVR